MFYSDLRVQAQNLSELGSKIVAMQKDLKAQKNIIETLFDVVPALIFYKDANNRVIKINKFGADLWGAKKDDILGYGWKDLVTEEQAEDYFRNDLDVIKSGKAKMNIVEPLVGDPNRIFLTHKLPMYEDGEVIGVIGFSTEITEPLRRNGNGQNS